MCAGSCFENFIGNFYNFGDDVVGDQFSISTGSDSADKQCSYVSSDIYGLASELFTLNHHPCDALARHPPLMILYFWRYYKRFIPHLYLWMITINQTTLLPTATWLQPSSDQRSNCLRANAQLSSRQRSTVFALTVNCLLIRGQGHHHGQFRSC